MDLEERRVRLTRLLVIEIDRVVRQLGDRREQLVRTWSRARAREPFAHTLFHRYRTIGASDLFLLEADALVAVDAFYEAVDDAAIYFQYTEDMPVTLEERYDEAFDRIAEASLAARAALGAPVEEGRA